MGEHIMKLTVGSTTLAWRHCQNMYWLFSDIWRINVNKGSAAEVSEFEWGIIVDATQVVCTIPEIVETATWQITLRSIQSAFLNFQDK